MEKSVKAPNVRITPNGDAPGSNVAPTFYSLHPKATDEMLPDLSEKNKTLITCRRTSEVVV